MPGMSLPTSSLFWELAQAGAAPNRQFGHCHSVLEAKIFSV